jgi:hypothetical protein
MSSSVQKYISSGTGQITINGSYVLFILFMVLAMRAEENHENLRKIDLWAKV